MTPDPATITRRRHAVLTVVRAGALLCVAKAVWTLANTVSGVTFPSISTALQQVMDNGFPIVIWLLAAASLVIFDLTIVRWLVPLGSTDNLCPVCGYSLKDLKSPICPECGTDIK